MLFSLCMDLIYLHASTTGRIHADEIFVCFLQIFSKFSLVTSKCMHKYSTFYLMSLFITHFLNFCRINLPVIHLLAFFVPSWSYFYDDSHLFHRKPPQTTKPPLFHHNYPSQFHIIIIKKSVYSIKWKELNLFSTIINS